MPQWLSIVITVTGGLASIASGIEGIREKFTITTSLAFLASLTVCLGGAYTLIWPERVIPKEPLIAVFEGARFMNFLGDSVRVEFSIRNFGDGKAKNVKKFSFAMSKSNGTLSLYTVFPVIDKDSAELVAGQSTIIYYDYHIPKMNPANEEYIYFKVDYNDELGKPQQPLRLNIYVPYPGPNVLIADIHPEQDRIVNEYIKKIGLW